MRNFIKEFISFLFVFFGFICSLSVISCVNEEYIGEQKRIVNINIDKRDSLDTPITFSENIEDYGDDSLDNIKYKEDKET